MLNVSDDRCSDGLLHSEPVEVDEEDPQSYDHTNHIRSLMLKSFLYQDDGILQS